MTFDFQQARRNREAFSKAHDQIHDELKFGHVKEEEDEFDYLPMPGDIYNDHLAKRVGPVIRIGTPISDLSLNELPSPRGIKDSDMFSKEGNLFVINRSMIQRGLLIWRTTHLQMKQLNGSRKKRSFIERSEQEANKTEKRTSVSLIIYKRRKR